MGMALAKVPNEQYVVDPPDRIAVELPDQPELSRTQQVRSDGVIVLPLVGEVHVARKTTSEIREMLEEMYAAYYKELSIIVQVTAFRSKQIFVYGEVRRVGPQPYTGYQTVLDALGRAGGVTTRAAWKRAKVVRPGLEGQEVFSVNLKGLLLEGDATQNVQLAEDDVLYVPPTVLAWIGYRIRSLLFPASAAASLATVGEATPRAALR